MSGSNPILQACQPLQRLTGFFAAQRATRAAQIARLTGAGRVKNSLFIALFSFRLFGLRDTVPCRLPWLQCSTVQCHLSSPVPCNLLFAQILYRAFVQNGTVQGGGRGAILYL